MKLIGYWRDDFDPDMPNPRTLVQPGHIGGERADLIQYLKSAPMFRGQWGFSWCRFRCGVSDAEMGSREFTDGVWLWPEGLVHYVEHHDVVLPDAFLDHCRSQCWKVDLNAAPTSGEVDTSFWREWADEKALELGL